MLSLYYRIWADAITSEKKKRAKDSEWKLFTMIIISLMQGLNLLALLFIFRWLSHGEMPILLPVHIFNMTAINGFCAIFLVFFLPFVLLNYLLILYDNRFQQLITRYPGTKGKLFRNYCLISIGIIVVPIVFKTIF